MLSKMAMLAKSRTLFKTLNPARNSLYLHHPITTFAFLSQEPQLVEPASESQDPPSSSPLPPNPAYGSPLYHENWRNPIPMANATAASSLMPIKIFNSPPSSRVDAAAQHMDVESLLNLFADWTTFQRWEDMTRVFELWIRSLDKNGKPNKPDVDIYNHYLRANLMIGLPVEQLLDLMSKMEDYAIEPNTASYNLVLKAMSKDKETKAAEKLLERMLHSQKEAQPDDESFDLIVSMLFLQGQDDEAFRYIDMTLKSGCMLSHKVFTGCVQCCVRKGSLDTLVSIIEKCKATSQNKTLCPTWNLCNVIVEAAVQNDNSKLAFFGLEFLARWIAMGENASQPVFVSVNEGLIVSSLAAAARTHSLTLLDASWAVLKRSLHRKKDPTVEAYLAKINAYASMGNLPRAFSTLNELESAHSVSSDAEKDILCPFTSLYPLVVACSKKGFETLDLVYFQLENLSRAEKPYKSVSALNCVILGCANIWDLDRAYQTFEAIGSSFELTPNIHSYNALMYAFGKLKKTFEASRVFEHLIGLGVKPNAMSYSLLVDAHLVNRDPKSALSVVDKMVEAGFIPSRDTLKKIRRRCIREMDIESNDRLASVANLHRIRLGNEDRRDMLFNLRYMTEYAT